METWAKIFFSTHHMSAGVWVPWISSITESMASAETFSRCCLTIRASAVLELWVFSTTLTILATERHAALPHSQPVSLKCHILLTGWWSWGFFGQTMPRLTLLLMGPVMLPWNVSYLHWLDFLWSSSLVPSPSQDSRITPPWAWVVLPLDCPAGRPKSTILLAWVHGGPPLIPTDVH